MHKVSVVIPTTPKELELAEKCAESIRRSTYKNVEILVINEGKERSEQRNIGIDRATGDYIMYLDSDQSVSPRLIEECVRLMKDGFSGVYIPEIITTPGWFGRLRNFERSFYDGTPIDCVRFIRKSVCPKFSTELHGPEDSLHDRKVKGFKVVAENCLYHMDGIGVVGYFKKKAYYTKSMREYAKLSPNDQCLDFKYRCFTVFIENGKWKKIVKHPIAFIGIMLMVLIRGVIYVRGR